jgi:hypothetical protein
MPSCLSPIVADNLYASPCSFFTYIVLSLSFVNPLILCSLSHQCANDISQMILLHAVCSLVTPVHRSIMAPALMHKVASPWYLISDHWGGVNYNWMCKFVSKLTFYHVGLVLGCLWVAALISNWLLLICLPVLPPLRCAQHDNIIYHLHSSITFVPFVNVIPCCALFECSSHKQGSW